MGTNRGAFPVGILWTTTRVLQVISAWGQSASNDNSGTSPWTEVLARSLRLSALPNPATHAAHTWLGLMYICLPTHYFPVDQSFSTFSLNQPRASGIGHHG